MITVVDLGIGNISSVTKALKRLGADFRLSNDPAAIASASKILLPGVGAFGAGMEAIHKLALAPVLREAALERRVPLMGICMGMQLLASVGEESGRFEGLGIIPRARVISLDLKACPAIPHMGWNNLESIAGNPLFKGLAAHPDFYFVHSFHMVDIPKDVTVNTCEYGGPVTAAISHGNVMGTQFHPEKSQANGLAVLRNFIQYA